MCELLAISSRLATAVTYSLTEFAKHGGLTHQNTSGWGIAYYQDRDTVLIKEPKPAAESPWVDFVAAQRIESDCVLAHVRLATVGPPVLQNTHPFRRILAGRTHVFAHNGTLPGIAAPTYQMDFHYRPLGDTDSEIAFCLLLEQMEPIWRQSTGFPSLEERFDVFVRHASEMKRAGPANLLYSDGDVLFIHADRRAYEENGKFGKPRPPGLCMKNCLACQERPDWSCEGLKLQMQDQRTIIFASVPLDDVGWEALQEGTAVAVRKGEEVGRRSTC